jgi:hypothetical protein
VTIDELVLGVSIALGVDPPSLCAAMDANADSAVSIAELIGAVEHALRGCRDRGRDRERGGAFKVPAVVLADVCATLRTEPASAPLCRLV